jgi:hypothetical protein
VTKEVDWKRYDSCLRNQSDLELVVNNSMFNVYRSQENISKAYSVDRKVYVANYTQYLERSRSEDTTEGVYVLNRSRAGEVEMLDGAGRQPVDVSQSNPATYRVEDASESQLTVFTQRQDNSYDDWRLNGRDPESLHLGLAPVFESREGTLRYSRFYNVYMPSYAVSLGTLLVLIFAYLRPDTIKKFKDRVSKSLY